MIEQEFKSETSFPIYSFQQLKHQRDQLKIYQKKIEVQLEKDRATAKQALDKGNKEYGLIVSLYTFNSFVYIIWKLVCVKCN
jgi:heme oxygenase